MEGEEDGRLCFVSLEALLLPPPLLAPLLEQHQRGEEEEDEGEMILGSFPIYVTTEIIMMMSDAQLEERVRLMNEKMLNEENQINPSSTKAELQDIFIEQCERISKKLYEIVC